MIPSSLEMVPFVFVGNRLTAESTAKLSALSATNKKLVARQVLGQFNDSCGNAVRTLHILTALGVSTEEMENALRQLDSRGPELCSKVQEWLDHIASDAAKDAPQEQFDPIDWATKRGSN